MPPIGLIVGSEEFLFPALGLFLTFMSTNGQMDQDMLRESLMTGGIEDTGRRTAVNILPSVAGTQGVTLRRLRGFQSFDGSVGTSFPPGPVTYYYNQHERAYEGIRSDDVHPSNCIEVNQRLHDGIRAGSLDPSVERQRYMLLPNERSIDQPIIIEEMPVESCIGKTCSVCGIIGPETIDDFFRVMPRGPTEAHWDPLSIATLCCGCHYICGPVCSGEWKGSCSTCRRVYSNMVSDRQHEDMMDRLRGSGPEVEARNAASEAEVADRDERALQTYLRLQRRRSDSGASTIDREQYDYNEDEEQSTVDEEREEEGSGILRAITPPGLRTPIRPSPLPVPASASASDVASSPSIGITDSDPTSPALADTNASPIDTDPETQARNESDNSPCIDPENQRSDESGTSTSTDSDDSERGHESNDVSGYSLSRRPPSMRLHQFDGSSTGASAYTGHPLEQGPYANDSSSSKSSSASAPD